MSLQTETAILVRYLEANDKVDRLALDQARMLARDAAIRLTLHRERMSPATRLDSNQSRTSSKSCFRASPTLLPTAKSTGSRAPLSSSRSGMISSWQPLRKA